MINEHAPLAPSSAPQWGECSGSVLANMDAPNLETEDMRRGTATHWIGSEVLNNYKSSEKSLLLCRDYVGKKAPNGVIIDDEMAEGADIYVKDVLEVAQKYGALQNMIVEHRVRMPQIHEQNWGTLDCAIPLLDRGLIYIWDYKNGHRENSARNNFQLINYVAGLVDMLGINGSQDQHLRVVIRIVQPFCFKAHGPIDEWVVQLSDLRGHFNQLHMKAHAAFSSPKLNTGIWCRDCSAVKNCVAARRANYNLIDYVNAPYEMDTMTGADLATERRIIRDGLAAAKARFEAIEDELKNRISNGATDTGLTLQSSSGRLEWTVPPEQAIALAGNFQADISVKGVKTPTQAKTFIPYELRQQFIQVLNSVTRRPSGALKLTDVKDSIGSRAFKRK